MATDSIIVLKPSSAFARAGAGGKKQYTSASFNGGFTDAPIVIVSETGWPCFGITIFLKRGMRT